jgi:hypothetical protein
MNGICGSEASASLGGPGRARRATLGLLLAAVACVALAAPPVALSAGGSSTPSPQRLWRSYPLDSAHRGKLRPAGSTAGRPHATSTAGAQSSSGGSWPVWLGILAGVLVLGAAAFALVRRRASLRPFMPRDLVGRARKALRRGGTAPAEPAQPTELAAARPERPRPEARPLNGALLGEARRVAAAAPTSVSPPGREPAKARDETVLKRKQRTTDRAVETLKEKRPAASARGQDVGVLKEKLAEPAQRRSNGASRAASGDSAVASPPAVVRAPARTAARPSCRIEWWRGYVKSEFQARVRRLDGSEAILLTSPAFRWSKSTPPPKELPHVERAHAALVAELKAAGWKPRRRGTQWFALELQLGHDLPERKGQHEDGS